MLINSKNLIRYKRLYLLLLSRVLFLHLFLLLLSYLSLSLPLDLKQSSTDRTIKNVMIWTIYRVSDWRVELSCLSNQRGKSDLTVVQCLCNNHTEKWEKGVCRAFKRMLWMNRLNNIQSLNNEYSRLNRWNRLLYTNSPSQNSVQFNGPNNCKFFVAPW